MIWISEESKKSRSSTSSSESTLMRLSRIFKGCSPKTAVKTTKPTLPYSLKPKEKWTSSGNHNSRTISLWSFPSADPPRSISRHQCSTDMISWENSTPAKSKDLKNTGKLLGPRTQVSCCKLIKLWKQRNDLNFTIIVNQSHSRINAYARMSSSSCRLVLCSLRFSIFFSITSWNLTLPLFFQILTFASLYLLSPKLYLISYRSPYLLSALPPNLVGKSHSLEEED